MQTFKLQTFKDANVHSQIQSSKVVLFEESLLTFEARDLNVEWYTKIVAAVWNAIQWYHVIYDEKKRYPVIPRHHWTVFSRLDRSESSREPESLPLRSGMSETAACPISHIV